MMADDILAARGSERDICGCLSWLGAEIQKAHRLDLSVEVARSAAAVCALPMEQQLKALMLCRWPFPLTWLEWPGSATSDVVRRFGALVAADTGLQRGRIALAWDLSVPEVSPWEITFDWRPDAILPVPTSVGRRRTRAELAASNDPLIVRSDLDAVIENDARYGNDELPVLAEMHRRALINPEAGDEIWQIANSRMAGMPDFIRAALLLINSKNLTGQEPIVAPAKLQRARARRRAAPILDHTQIRLKLSKALAARATDAQPGSGMRLHLVRGHFKIRKSGVFWWAPFQRGSAALGTIARQDRHVIRLNGAATDG